MIVVKPGSIKVELLGLFPSEIGVIAAKVTKRGGL